MAYNPKIHHRRSMRLRTWDYSWRGWYYVTIVVKNRSWSFGMVRNGLVMLSALGRAADDCWRQIPKHHAGVELDEYVIMPDHVHGIIILNDWRGVCQGVQLNALTKKSNVPAVENDQRPSSSKRDAMAALSPAKGSLAVVIRTFKAAVTTWARNNGLLHFAWQTLFYDHIVRNDADLQRIRAYILNNPRRWTIDKERFFRDQEG